MSSADPVVRRWRRWSVTHVFRRSTAYLAMIALAAVSLIPFLWMVSTSFKTLPEVLQFPPSWLPNQFNFGNYTSLWQDFPMNAWIWNSFKISILVTIGTLITCSLSGYAFARLTFPGRELIFYAYLTTMMVPTMVYQVPRYALIRELGWYNTHTALIVPSLWAAFGTFMLRQFFLTIPRELEEAARVDGAGYFQTFTKIILPLSGPALATLTIFTFIGTFNDFLGPLLYLDDLDKYTLQTGLGFLSDSRGVDWERLMAGDVIALLPMVVLFAAAQKYYVQGIALTGVK
jgi:multiple sugar transport system permease protein